MSERALAPAPNDPTGGEGTKVLRRVLVALLRHLSQFLDGGLTAPEEDVQDAETNRIAEETKARGSNFEQIVGNGRMHEL